MLRGDIWPAIIQERNRQNAKWGNKRQNPPMKRLTILVEEVGELAEALLGIENAQGIIRGILEQELIHIAAVAVAWLEDDL